MLSAALTRKFICIPICLNSINAVIYHLWWPNGLKHVIGASLATITSSGRQFTSATDTLQFFMEFKWVQYRSKPTPKHWLVL